MTSVLQLCHDNESLSGEVCALTSPRAFKVAKMFPSAAAATSSDEKYAARTDKCICRMMAAGLPGNAQLYRKAVRSNIFLNGAHPFWMFSVAGSHGFISHVAVDYFSVTSHLGF